MNQLPDTVLLIMGAICIVPTVYMLIIFKDIKVMIAGLIILIGSQVAVFAIHGEPSWHVMALLFFPMVVILYMMIKIKQRINAALKRIAQIEAEEEKEKEREARKEKIRNEVQEPEVITTTLPRPKEQRFIGDTHDHGSV